jgi:hypothetical protein
MTTVTDKQKGTIAAILALVEAAIVEIPALIQDIEDLVNKAKTVPTGDFNTAPLEPVIEAETQPLADKMK